MYLTEVGCKELDWIHLSCYEAKWQDHVSTVMNLWITLNAGNFLISRANTGFLRKTLFHGVSMLVYKIITLDDNT